MKELILNAVVWIFVRIKYLISLWTLEFFLYWVWKLLILLILVLLLVYIFSSKWWWKEKAVKWIIFLIFIWLIFFNWILIWWFEVNINFYLYLIISFFLFILFLKNFYSYWKNHLVSYFFKLILFSIVFFIWFLIGFKWINWNTNYLMINWFIINQKKVPTDKDEKENLITRYYNFSNIQEKNAVLNDLKNWIEDNFLSYKKYKVSNWKNKKIILNLWTVDNTTRIWDFNSFDYNIFLDIKWNLVQKNWHLYTIKLDTLFNKIKNNICWKNMVFLWNFNDFYDTKNWSWTKYIDYYNQYLIENKSDNAKIARLEENKKNLINEYEKIKNKYLIFNEPNFNQNVTITLNRMYLSFIWWNFCFNKNAKIDVILETLNSDYSILDQYLIKKKNVVDNSILVDKVLSYIINNVAKENWFWWLWSFQIYEKSLLNRLNYNWSFFPFYIKFSSDDDINWWKVLDPELCSDYIFDNWFANSLYWYEKARKNIVLWCKKYNLLNWSKFPSIVVDFETNSASSLYNNFWNLFMINPFWMLKSTINWIKWFQAYWWMEKMPLWEQTSIMFLYSKSRNWSLIDEEPTIDISNNYMNYLNRANEINWWFFFSIFEILNRFLLTVWSLFVYVFLIFILYKIISYQTLWSLEEDLKDLKRLFNWEKNIK